eukprot:g14229.t2
MGTLLDKPVTDKKTETEKGPDGIEFGVSAMQGWRVDMEDSHTIIANVEGLEGHSFVAIYDGHGGESCAAYAGKNMMRHIRETPEFATYAEMTKKDTKVLEKALYQAFLDCDKSVKISQDNNAEGDRSGSTAVASFVTPTHVVLAHAGDSRAVLASGQKMEATEDHKPYNDGERARIEKAGGVVSMKRVDGDLAVSRALGDFQYKDDELDAKDCKVSPAPETRSIPRSDQDEFLIVACDGIWDVMNNEDCAQAVRDIFEEGESDVGLACEEILDMCLEEGSRDNMSAVLVTFPGLKRSNKGDGVMGRRNKRTSEDSESNVDSVSQDEEQTPEGGPAVEDSTAESKSQPAESAVSRKVTIMGEHEPLVGPPKQDLLAEACGEEDAVGKGRSKSSSSISSTTSTMNSTSSSGSAGEASSSESPRTSAASPYGLGAESFPVCPNCQLRHPAGKSKGVFCTEGKQGMLEALVAMGTLGLFCGWCHLVIFGIGLLAFHALVYKSVFTLTAVAVLLINFIWWPVNNRCYPNEAFCNSWLFAVWRRYFRWQCVLEEPLDQHKRYMFAEMPHGVMPVGQLLSCSVVRHVFPGPKHISGVAADVVLRMPGIRILYSWLGIRKAGRQSILDMFEQNINVAVVVGGIAEMFMVSKTTETLYLRKRKNFTKIAIEAGADIVPVYFFGNTLLHDLVGGNGDENSLYRLSRKFKTALVFFYGRFGTPIPRRKELKMVAGRPISVVQSDEPSDEYVESLHAELVRRVEELYYKHRPDWEKRTLVIT